MTVSVREAYAIWKRDFRRGRLLGDYGDFNARFREMAYSTGLMALPAGWTLPRWSMFGGRVGSVLGSRGGVGGVLGSGRGGAAAPWWLAGGVSAANCVAAYQPKGAASLAASYVNLANPGTYDASAPVAAPTFDTATGWTFNGSTQHLLTGIVPANLTYTYIVRFSDGPTSGGGYSTVLSSYNGNSQCVWMSTKNTAGYRMYGHGNLLNSSGAAAAAGVQAIVGNGAYFNGSSEGTIPTGSTPTPQITIATLNNGGTPATSTTFAFNGKIQAIAIYNTTLTAPQVAAISAAMSLL